MNKRLLLIILITLTVISCQDENLENVSNIRFDNSDDFRISSITPGSNGTIWCLGRKGTEILIAKQFDASFNLIQEIHLTETKGIEWGAQIRPNFDGGWLVAQSIEESLIVNFEVQVLNEQFEVIKSNTSQSVAKSQEPRLTSFIALKSGDYILNYQRTIFPIVQGTVISLNSNLELKWDITYENIDYKKSEFIETNDGRVRFAGISELRTGTSANGSTRFYLTPLSTLHVGLIDENGVLLLDSQIRIQSHHTLPIGISHTSDDFVFNFITNDEHIQQYVSVSFDGTSSIHRQLGFNFINHQIVDGFSNGHFPLGGANPLPRTLKPGQGHLIYSEVDKKLQFLEVSSNADLTWRFPINLPEFDELLSYRQLFTDHETIIIGVSYVYLDKEYFVLQEITMDGKVLQ